MDRRLFLAGAGAVALVPAIPLAQTTSEGGGENARLRALLDAFFEEAIDESPERATALGLDKGARAPLKARLDDASAEEKARDLARARDRQARLRTVDRSKLSGMAVVDYDVVDYQLATYIAGASRFTYGSAGGRYAPYVISQNTGAYQDIPDFLDNQHKVETAEDAEAYLSRLSAFAVVMDQERERAEADAARGVIPPTFLLDLAEGQMNALRQRHADEVIMVTSIAKKAKAANLPGDWAGRAQKIVEGEVHPALDRQLALVADMRRRATADAGAWKLPDGEAYYAAAVGASTTTKLTPSEVHQLGLDQVAEITAQMDAILKAEGLSKGTVAERMAALNDDPRQLYANTDEGRVQLIADLNRQIEALYPRLPEVFGRMPKAKVEVRRVPPFIQDGASNGYYQRPALDGSRPGVFFINLKDTKDWPKFSLPTLTYHEAAPGHHLQVSLQMESTEIPLIRRTGGFSAYSEGWALYAEQLASEMGAYRGDPLGEAGFLQSFLFRAARLVVDTGIHHKRWSREKAIDYMVGVTGYARGRTEREIDRYCSWPGQACSYKVGHTVWARLREEAKAGLGPRFDLKGFHDVALASGAMPLTVLERRIKDWQVAQAA